MLPIQTGTHQLKLSDQFPPLYHHATSSITTIANINTTNINTTTTTVTATSQCQGPHKNNLKQIILQGFHPNIPDEYSYWLRYGYQRLHEFQCISIYQY